MPFVGRIFRIFFCIFVLLSTAQCGQISGRLSGGSSSSLLPSNPLNPSVSEKTIGFSNVAKLVDENDGTSSFTIQISEAPTENLTVEYMVYGDAKTSGKTTISSGSAVIPAGSTTVNVNFNLVNDGVVDGDKTLFVAITNVSQGHITIGTNAVFQGMVIDDEGAAPQAVLQVASQYNDILYLLNDGTLRALGLNSYGQLGVGNSNPVTTPTTVDGIVKYKQIAMETYYSCGITVADKLKCWGLNGDGQLGVGGFADATSPTAADAATNYNEVKVAWMWACGLTSTDDLKCWGRGDFGQSGLNTTGDTATPTAVSATKFKSFELGYLRTCAISDVDDLYCWGKNDIGEVGDNNPGVNRLTPFHIDAGTKYKAVFPGNGDTGCAITLTDDLKCWGRNDKGQLGNGTRIDSPVPVTIDAGVKYSEVTPGYDHTCGLTTGGILKCWGFSSTVLHTSTSPFVVPTTNFTIDTFANTSDCGLTSTGAAYCWTFADTIQADTTITQTATFLAYDSGSTFKTISPGNAGCSITTSDQVKCARTRGYTNPQYVMSAQTIDSARTYKKVRSGRSHICAISSNDELFCLGSANNGQLGDDDINESGRPVPIRIDAGTKYTDIDTGWNTSCGVTTAGDVKCWGYGADYALGLGDEEDRYTPVKVSLPEPQQSIATRGFGACSIGISGQLYCWGQGPAGDNTWDNLHTPVAIDVGTLYRKIVAGEMYTCGLTTANKYKCFGDGWQSPMGQGNTDDFLVATELHGGQTYVTLGAGAYHGCGILLGGALNCWGDNSYGQLGDGTINDSLVPIPIDAGTNYLKISSHNYDGMRTCGITTANKLRCWGDANFGRLGNGSLISSLWPIDIDAANDYKDISVGANISCGVTTGGTLRCWGYNWGNIFSPSAGESALLFIPNMYN